MADMPVACSARYRGSADAVRMNLENIMDPFAGEPVDDLLVLSGNGLYDIVRGSALSPPACRTFQCRVGCSRRVVTSRKIGPQCSVIALHAATAALQIRA